LRGSSSTVPIVLDGVGGDEPWLTISGDGFADELGTAVAAGDFDGDDVPDLVIAAPGSDNGGYDAGEVRVIFGAGLR
jgi:hypothetical protein